MKKLLSVLLGFLIISSCKDKDKDTPPPPIAVANISLSPSSLTLKVDDTSTLKAVITPENAANKAVAWSSSAESVASVSSTGLVTAKGTGTAIITVTTNDKNKTASCTVTVSLLVSSIALTPNPTSVGVGSRVQLIAAVTPENAPNKTVTWSSSDVSKATVDQDGWVTGVALGAVTITATATDGSAVKGEATITVKNTDVAVSAITLGAENLSVAVPAEGATTTLANAPRTISSNLAAVPVNITAAAGATIKIGTAAFTQGQAVDFTNPVTFTVTAEDGTTVKNYSVSIPAYNAVANPYGIYTVNDLVDVKNGLSDSFLLKNVIALPSANAEGATATGIRDYVAAGWLPLGPFTGTFDGGNFSITNFYVNRMAEKVGLFGELGRGGTIKNLGVIGISGTTETKSSTGRSIDGYQYVGLLVGYSAGTIDKCQATGSVSSSSSSSSAGAYAGGLAGFSSGAISNSSAGGSVSSYSSYSLSPAIAGGLVGLSSGSISNSYATGNTTTTTTYYSSAHAGGLVGSSSGSISNSYATGNASSSSATVADAGGLVGSSSGSISNSYATGSVSSSSASIASDAYAGGLVGYNTNNISNSYATGNVSSYYSSSSYYSGGLVGYNTSSISNSYATGNVSSYRDNSSSYPPSYAGSAGGLVGRNSNGRYTNCYRNSNATVNPGPTDASIAGILAKTKVEMQAPAFVTSLNSSGTSVWGSSIGKNDDLPFIKGVGVGK